MPISTNKIKYLASLKIKKFRSLHQQFIVEGDKMTRAILQDGRTIIPQLIASGEWLAANQALPNERIGEIVEADMKSIARISAFETPAPVLIVVDIPRTQLDSHELSASWSLALDNIQDPGNLGTIIRTANWFGIKNIVCSLDCADCYSPKVVQASMGALLNIKIHYAGIVEIIDNLLHDDSFKVYGTFMEGTPVYDLPAASKGMILFGNEARGISEALFPFIHSRFTIPPAKIAGTHVESLNVASAVAIVCAMLIRK
jgi:RNA methyltransferase, TrmH family